MIIAVDGTVRLEGDEALVSAETAMVLNLIYETLKDKVSEQYALEQIVEIGRLAVLDREELECQARNLGLEN
ncbi:MAG: hypothetical protein ACSW8G_07145 [Bacillota bacterium]